MRVKSVKHKLSSMAPLNLPGNLDHIVRLKMPVKIQADDKRLILRNDPVGVEVTMQMFFNSEVDDFLRSDGF